MTGKHRQISVDERRARLGRRHLLGPDCAVDSPVAAARAMVALHATDQATVHLAAAARMSGAKIGDIEQALYQERSLIRMLGMRRTMFVVPLDLVPVVQASSTDAIAARERERLLTHLRQAGAGDERFLAAVERSTLAALARRGSATAAQLSEDEPRLRTQLIMAEGKAYGGPQNICTRVLGVLAAHGHIVRGRPRGSWVSGQYHWAAAADWLPAVPEPWSAPAARVELARRWLYAFGPAPASDLKWWSGWTMGQVKAALAEIDTVTVDLDGTPGLLLADDADEVDPPGPWVALLPALDPTPMGWAGRQWYLGGHAAALFDRSGNIGPSIWVDGRVVGGWAQGPDGRVVVRLLERVPRSTSRAIDEAADRLTDWLGGVRVTPRFRTPLERELSGAGT